MILRIKKWAEGEENVRAGLIIGSRARVDHPADEWSDLNVVLIVKDLEPILNSSNWLEDIRPFWLSFIEVTGGGSRQERRVLFDGGLDVDYAPVALEEFKQAIALGLPPGVEDMVRRGVRVLVDKESQLGSLLDVEFKARSWNPPDEDQFLNNVNDFWFHALWTARNLRRGELWWANGGCDSYMKGLLKQMMEWHTRVTASGETDTWMRGRFLEEWAHPRAVKQLPEIFARYDEDDIWRALLKTMDLLRWLAVETAEALSFNYPSEVDPQVRLAVNNLREGQSLMDAVSV